MKKIILKFLAGIMILGFQASLSAQSIDAKSKSILDKLTSNYKSKKNSYFKFTYQTGTPAKITKRETGIFYSEKDKYKLKIMGIEQIFDGHKVYSINDEDMEVTISKPSANQNMFSPLSYLESYKNDYNVKYAGKNKISGIPVDIIKMTPAKANGIKTVTLYVNTAQNKLIKLEQLTSNNDLAIITISNYKENQNLSPSLFGFDRSKYQNYLITEL